MAEPNEPKKETVRITLPPRGGQGTMADDDDTVRINLPSRPPVSEPLPNAVPLAPKSQSVPIPQPPMAQNPLPVPPSLEPKPEAASPRMVPPSIVPPPPPLAKTPLPRPIDPKTAAAEPVPAPAPAPAVSSGKETTRMSVLPDPSKPQPAKMRKTQPLITLTATPVSPPAAPVTVAPPERAPVIDAIPLPICWALVAISAAILIIEIWNYIS